MHYTPVYTKKNRPATHLTLLIQEGDLERFTAILFEQTSTIGFRYQNVQRKVMTRTFETQQTRHWSRESKEKPIWNCYKINIRI